MKTNDLNLSVNTYVYEAIQRKYRNCVIQKIRISMNNKYGENWIEHIYKLFKTEWETIKQNAEISRYSGEITSQIIDDLDYLGVNHFYNIFDVYFDVIFLKSKFTKDISNAPKDAILKWSKSVINIRNPISHPGEIDLSILDAIQVVDSARRIVQFIDYAKELRDICSALINRERGDSEPSRILDNNLPAPEIYVIDFIGRIEQLEELYTWFADSSQKRWMLDGAGGQGKSAIAYRFATQVKNSAPTPYTMVLWFSAKRRKFLEGSTYSIHNPDITDLDSALNKLLVDYGWGEITNYSREDKVEFTLQLLNEFPILIVIDDIDTLEEEDDEAVAFFFFEVPNTKSKVLYTSRTKFPGMSKCSTLVEGFLLEEARKYMETLISKHFTGNTHLTDEDIKAIHRVTEGSPLYIEDLLRLHASGYPLADCISQWSVLGKEARSFSLRHQLDQLTEQAQKVLLSCCINREPTTISDLEVVTRMSQPDVMKSIGELSKLFLVPKPQIIEGVPRFDVNINTRLLVLEVMSSYGTFADIKSAFNSIHGDIITSGKRRADVRAYQRQAITNIDADRQADAENILVDVALQEYPNDPDILGQLGWVYLRWKPLPRIEDARFNFSRAAKLKCTNASMYWQWWRMEADRNNWPFAIDASKKGLTNCPNNLELQYCLGYSRSRHGKSLELQFQYQRAQDEFRKAERVLEKAFNEIRKDIIGKNKLFSQVCRALIITCDAEIKYVDPKKEKTLEDNLKRKIRKIIEEWQSELPEDEFMIAEKARMQQRYPGLLVGNIY